MIDTMQKQDVLQIITVLGNFKLEIPQRALLAKMSLNTDIRYYIPWRYELFSLNFLLEIHTKCIERIGVGSESLI